MALLAPWSAVAAQGPAGPRGLVGPAGATGNVGPAGDGVLNGNGSPEGVVTAGPGSLYRQLDGATGANLWSKDSGAGNVGWKLNRRVIPYTMSLLAQQPDAGKAQQAGIAAAYGFQTGALSASTGILLSGLNPARVRNALGRIIWTPKDAACGIEIVSFDDGPVNIVQIGEVTGNASAAPIPSFLGLTAAVQNIIDTVTSQGVPTGGNSKNLGYRTKGNGVVGPLLFVVEINMLLEV